MMTKSIRTTVASLLSVGLLALAAPAGAGGPQTKLISKRTDGDKATGGTSYEASVSTDGRYVVFTSSATNLPGANGFDQIYVRDRQNATTKLVSKNNSGNAGDRSSFQPSISGGRFVAFASNATNMPGPSAETYSHVYLRDLQEGETFLISRNSADGPASGGASEQPFVTSGGRFVAFESAATNLPGNLGGESQIYLRDRATGTTRLVSKNNANDPANSDSDEPTASSDGRFIAFESDASNLPAEAGNNTGQDRVYVRDRIDDETFLVSRNSAGTPANNTSSDPTISGSGRFVAFESNATNLPGDVGPLYTQVYLRDRRDGTTRLVSKTPMGDPASGGASENGSVSANGRYVAFESYASNLPGTGGVDSVYLRKMSLSGARLVSKNNAGDQADGQSHIPPAARVTTARGEFVVFNSYAENLPGSIGPGYAQVYIRGPLN